jgi:hypothetical protein
MRDRDAESAGQYVEERGEWPSYWHCMAIDFLVVLAISSQVS